jgi:hypothetical protein
MERRRLVSDHIRQIEEARLERIEQAPSNGPHAIGITAGGQKLAGLLVFLTDVHSLGLKTAQGLTITSAWYWDKDDASRAFAKRFMPRNPTGMPPTYTQAGVYTEVAQYLKAIQAAGTDDADKVVAELRKMKINDFNRSETFAEFALRPLPATSRRGFVAVPTEQVIRPRHRRLVLGDP